MMPLRPSAISREGKAAIARAWKVPGLYRQGEGLFLYRLARRKGNLVELGCWMGRSTAILVQAAQHWGASVTSVDAFVPMPHGYKQATPEAWRRNLERAKLTPPRLLAMRSEDAALIYDKPIALLFIDADHSYECVKRDLAMWGPKVQRGGVIALHDMFFPSITGVCRALAEWWSEERDGDVSRWVLAGMHDYTIAFRRQK